MASDMCDIDWNASRRQPASSWREAASCCLCHRRANVAGRDRSLGASRGKFKQSSVTYLEDSCFGKTAGGEENRR